MKKFIALVTMLIISVVQPLSANITPMCYGSQANGRIVLVLSIDPTEAVLTRQTEAQIKALIDFMNEQKLDPNFRLLLMLGIREGHEARLPQSETALLKAVCPFSRMLSEDLSQKDSRGEPLYPDFKDLPSVPAENIRVQLNALLKRAANPFAPTPASTTQNIFEEDFIDLFDQAINGYFNPIDPKRKALSLSNVNRAATIIVTNYPAPMVKEFFAPIPRMLKPASYDDFEQLNIMPGMTKAQADAVHAAREYHIRYVFNTAVQIKLNHHWATSSPLTDSLIAMATRIHAINVLAHPEAHAAAAGAGASGGGWACAATATSPARSGSGEFPAAACGSGASAERPDTPTEPRPECVTPPAAAAAAEPALAEQLGLTPELKKLIGTYCGIHQKPTAGKAPRMVGLFSTHLIEKARQEGVINESNENSLFMHLHSPLAALLQGARKNLTVTLILETNAGDAPGATFGKTDSLLIEMLAAYSKDHLNVFFEEKANWPARVSEEHMPIPPGVALKIYAEIIPMWLGPQEKAQLLSHALQEIGKQNAKDVFNGLVDKDSDELIITNLPPEIFVDGYLSKKSEELPAGGSPAARATRTVYADFANCLTNNRLLGRAPVRLQQELFNLCNHCWPKPVKKQKTPDTSASAAGPASATAATVHDAFAANAGSGAHAAAAAACSVPHPEDVASTDHAGTGATGESAAPANLTTPLRADSGTGASTSPRGAASATLNTAEIFVDPAKACGHCGQYAKNRCTGCRQIRYCNRECQRADRKRHKETCAVAASESAASAS